MLFLFPEWNIDIVCRSFLGMFPSHFIFFIYPLIRNQWQSLWHLSPNPFNSISQQLHYHSSQSSGCAPPAPLSFVSSFYIPVHPFCVPLSKKKKNAKSDILREKKNYYTCLPLTVYMKSACSVNSSGSICKQAWHLSWEHYPVYPTVCFFVCVCVSTSLSLRSRGASLLSGATGITSKMEEGGQQGTVCQPAVLPLIRSTGKDKEEHRMKEPPDALSSLRFPPHGRPATSDVSVPLLTRILHPFIVSLISTATRGRQRSKRGTANRHLLWLVNF